MNRSKGQPLYRVVGFEVIPHRSVLEFTTVIGLSDLFMEHLSHCLLKGNLCLVSLGKSYVIASSTCEYVEYKVMSIGSNIPSGRSLKALAKRMFQRSVIGFY